jgi:predicted RNA-binding protein (virulence factor B family)
VHDKTDPELIKRMFSVSKKTFKKALGTLYRNQEITISEDGIYLSEED